ncbi:SDR family oxidoreductase [Colwellia sp. MEBiC06753]
MPSQLCLLTGASGGIGAALAKALSDDGYTLILQGRNLEKLEQVKRSLSRPAHILVGDLAIPEQRAQVLAQAFDFGAIELLINSAGTSAFGGFDTQTADDISQMININLVVPMLFTQAFISHCQPYLAKQSFKIINVGSAFGHIGSPGFTSYCASKFGLRGFTEALAREYQGTGISVSLFSPRATQTEINSPQVDALNQALGNSVDSPEWVAEQFIQFLHKKQKRKVLGWPEKLFAKINALCPTIVDKAIAGQLKTIKQFFQPHAEKQSSVSALNTVSLKEVHHEKL